MDSSSDDEGQPRVVYLAQCDGTAALQQPTPRVLAREPAAAPAGAPDHESGSSDEEGDGGPDEPLQLVKLGAMQQNTARLFASLQGGQQARQMGAGKSKAKRQRARASASKGSKPRTTKKLSQVQQSGAHLPQRSLAAVAQACAGPVGHRARLDPDPCAAAAPQPADPSQHAPACAHAPAASAVHEHTPLIDAHARALRPPPRAHALFAVQPPPRRSAAAPLRSNGARTAQQRGTPMSALRTPAPAATPQPAQHMPASAAAAATLLKPAAHGPSPFAAAFQHQKRSHASVMFGPSGQKHRTSAAALALNVDDRADDVIDDDTAPDTASPALLATCDPAMRDGTTTPRLSVVDAPSTAAATPEFAGLAAQQRAHERLVASLPVPPSGGASPRGRSRGARRSSHGSGWERAMASALSRSGWSQANTEAANRRARELTAAQLDARPRLRCRVEAPCCYEGHLVKLFCSLQDVSAGLDGAGDGAGRSAGVPAAAAGGQNHDRPRAGGAVEEEAALCTEGAALCTEVREGEVLHTAPRAFVFMHKDLAEAVMGTVGPGEAFVLLRPWDVLVLPEARFPVVLAFVGRPAA